MTSPLQIVRAGELDPRPERPRWLIHSLYPHPSVLIASGQPKSFKSWLGLDMGISVASGTPCLGCFAVELPGRVLVYLAEDSLSEVRERLGACATAVGSTSPGSTCM